MAVAATPAPAIWPKMDPQFAEEYTDTTGGKMMPQPEALYPFDPIFEHWKRQTPLSLGHRTIEDFKRLDNGIVGASGLEDWVKELTQDGPGGMHALVRTDLPKEIELVSEDNDRLKLSVVGNTRVFQVKELVGSYLQMSSDESKALTVLGKSGVYYKELYWNDTVQNVMKIKGVKNFCRQRKEYKHPAFIMGAGFGGICTALHLLKRGRTDFCMIERHDNFGGGSWLHVANKETKLQTEAGSYTLEFFFDDMPFPRDMPTWPSRDYLRMLFERGANRYGLRDYTMLSEKVTKVARKGKGDDRCFHVFHEPSDGTGDAEILTACAAFCWPGNLSTNKIEEYLGEDVFDGYVEYASLGKVDYTQVSGRVTVIIGHGAFAIENVRTCLEFDSDKMYMVCRRRNIVSPKPISWMVTKNNFPMAGPIMMDMLEDFYKMVSWNPWTAYSVTTDAKHSYARVDQGTMFGVTDIYFCAGYYGLMEVIVGGVKKLTYHAMHLKTGKKIQCEAILKTVGVRGNYEIDKILGIKELLGYWVNGDQLISCITNTLFVQASNFGGFSIAPGLAGETEAILWFMDWPEDFELVRAVLPVHNKGNNYIKGNALYVYPALHAMTTSQTMMTVPGLNLASNIANAKKGDKQHMAHPTEKFFKEVESEWLMYCDMCRSHPSSRKDVEDPPYPFDPDVIAYYQWRSEQWWLHGNKILRPPDYTDPYPRK